MAESRELPAGVGAFNARSEVVIFTDPLPGLPDAFRVDGHAIDVMEGAATVHGARYGNLIVEGAAKRDDVILVELAETGDVVRTTTLARRG